MKIGVPSLEFMKLQEDTFFDDLKAVVNKIRQDDKFTTKTVFESGLERVIFDRLKMSIEVVIVDRPNVNAAIELPSMDRNHIFFRALTNSFPNDVGKAISYFQDDKMRIGSVNIQTVTLGGIFQRIPLRMFLYRGLFNPRINDGEIAATILHELGHGFTFFFYLLHSAMANFISCKTATDIVGASGDKERVIILERGMRCLGLDGVGVQELLTQTPEQIATSIQALYINSTLSQLRSETGFGMYELRASEQLADWFAAKFGAALESATLQDKLMHEGKAMMLANTARSRAGVLTAVFYGVYIIQFSIPFPKFFSEIFYDETISRYDDDADRIKYMRQALIEELQNSVLPEDARKKLIKDIDAIKVIEKRVRKDKDTFGRSIAVYLKNKLIPNYRRNVSNIELQKTLEEAMYNDSFVYAAKLKGVEK